MIASHWKGTMLTAETPGTAFAFLPQRQRRDGMASSLPEAAAAELQLRNTFVASDVQMSDLHALSRRVLQLAGEKDLSLITAESCTAGKLSALLSEAPGAADRLHGSFVVYTKENKTLALGVPARLLAEQGAVCRDVAAAMAEGALARSPADVAVSITGVAGPDPDADGNPVGRVCIGLARRDGMVQQFEYSYGSPGREAVQERAMADALNLLITMIEAA